MMRLKVEKIEEGLHPSELVISIQTRDGPVSLVIDPSAIFPDDTVTIGWPVGRDEDFYLVEIAPRDIPRNFTCVG
jgi:hypothetical protein